MAPPRKSPTLVCPICGTRKRIAPAHLARGSTHRYCSRACSQSDPAIQERFWRRVVLCPHGRDCTACCWEWSGGHTPGGYGVLLVRKRVTLAHRYAFSLAYGPYFPDLCICHRCDNPPCCNPTHLFLGTQTDNMRDALHKGRLAAGEAHPSHLLTREHVRAIRTARHDGVAWQTIAQQMGVSVSTVWNAVHGHSWKDTRLLDAPAPAIRHPLTAEQVAAIREATAQGESSRTIARRMGIGKSTVGDILRGERHARR